MSGNLFRDLWPVFLEEVTEQLDALEFELLKENKKEIKVDHLFRLFHTIKSSCAMLEFTHMEEIAHSCEDVLDLVRQGNTAIDSRLVDLLLEAIDGLKGQLEESSQTQKNPMPRSELNRKVKAYNSDSKVDEEDHVTPIGFSLTRHEVGELEKYFSELLIVGISDPSVAGEAPVRNALVQLRNTCDLMGFKALSSLVNKLIKINEKKNPDLQRRLDVIVNILDRVEFLERALSRDFSVACCRKEMVNKHAVGFSNHLKQFVTLFKRELNSLSKSDNRKSWKVISKLDFEISLIIEYAKLFGCLGLYEYLNFIYQGIKQARIDRYIAESIKARVAEIIEPLSTINFDNELEIQKQYPVETLIHIYHGAKEGSEGEEKDLVQFSDIEDTGLSKFWERSLLQQDIGKLLSACSDGHSIAELFVDLESDTDFANKFAQMLYDSFTVLTNISNFDIDELHLEFTPTIVFLIINDKNANIERVVRNIDPTNSHVYCRLCNNDQQPAKGVASVNVDLSSQSLSTLRIDSKALDNFVSQIGEMVMLRNIMAHIVHDEEIFTLLKKSKSAIKTLGRKDPKHAAQLMTLINKLSCVHENLLQADARVQSAISKIQDEVLDLRVVPISMVFNRLPKVVHNLNKELGKEVALRIIGESEKVDKGLVDILMEPMLHLVRNAIDHGIESSDERRQLGKDSKATLLVQAETRGNMLQITVQDDGRGLNKQRIIAKAEEKRISVNTISTDDIIYNLIFMPGFSTSEKLTETSGRGVGLDAVKSRITQIGGAISVQSKEGAGTTFTLSLPLTVAIQGVVLVESDEQNFAMPERNVDEVISLRYSSVQSINGQAAYILRGEVLPLYSLDQLIYPSLGLEKSLIEDSSEKVVVVVSNGKNRIGLMVNKIIGRQEIFIRDINQELLKIPGLGGASILGDGSVVIILDCENILTLAENNAQSREILMRAVG